MVQTTMGHDRGPLCKVLAAALHPADIRFFILHDVLLGAIAPGTVKGLLVSTKLLLSGKPHAAAVASVGSWLRMQLFVSSQMVSKHERLVASSKAAREPTRAGRVARQSMSLQMAVAQEALPTPLYRTHKRSLPGLMTELADSAWYRVGVRSKVLFEFACLAIGLATVGPGTGKTVIAAHPPAPGTATIFTLVFVRFPLSKPSMP